MYIFKRLIQYEDFCHCQHKKLIRPGDNTQYSYVRLLQKIGYFLFPFRYLYSCRYILRFMRLHKYHLLIKELRYIWSFVWKTSLDDRPKPHVCKNYWNLRISNMKSVESAKSTESIKTTMCEICNLQSAKFTIHAIFQICRICEFHNCKIRRIRGFYSKRKSIACRGGDPLNFQMFVYAHKVVPRFERCPFSNLRWLDHLLATLCIL